MLQGGEVVIILIVALVFLGPTRLPALARKAGEYAAELRKAAREVRQGLEAEVSDLKTAGDEIRKVKDDIRRPFDEVKKGVDEVGVSRLEWKGPKPLSGPTPADAMADLDAIEAGVTGDDEAPPGPPPPTQEAEKGSDVTDGDEGRS